jgi:UDP-glucose 4-epimerase
MKTILVTGVAGLIGSRFSKWVLDNKQEFIVVGIDDFSGGYSDNVDERVIFYRRNLSTENIRDIFQKHNIEYVYHFAAYAAEGLSPFIRTFNYTNNLLTTAKLINESIRHEVSRFVFTSTLAVYGHGYGGVFDEDQIPAPIDPYGIAKYACEMDLKVACDQHGLDFCIIRPHNVYGRNQNIWDKYRNVLGIWMYQILKGKPLTIYGDGKQTRAFSYIDDSLEPLWRASQEQRATGQIINLGGIESISIRDAAEELCRVVGYDGGILHLEARHEVLHSIPTFQKSIDILGFEHRTSMSEGLKDMWLWAKMQPDRGQFIWEEYELEQGIYSYWKNK